MSSWLAALGPCASPKSRAKEHNIKDGSLETKVSLVSSKRQGSLTDVRSSRKVAGSRSFREKLQYTFDGSLRRTKKTGSLEAVAFRDETFGNPDTNMNVSTSFQPKAYKGSNSGNLTGGEPTNTNDNFWTNFYNTLPKNRLKTGRPNDLSLQNLPVSEMDSEAEQKNDEVFLEQTNATFKGFATSPQAKPKSKTTEGTNSVPNKTESTNSAPNSRKLAGGYEIDNRPGSDNQVIVEANEIAAREFQNANNVDCVLPRSLSLQDEYWISSAKGGNARHGLIKSSPDRLGVKRSPGASPVQGQGHVWIRTKDGSHLELRAVECHLRDVPSPSDSQKADSSSASYDPSTHLLTSMEIMQKFNNEHVLPKGSASNAAQTSDPTFTDSYMSPEQYQANIFELIQSLNQSPQSPASPEVRRSQEVKQAKSLADTMDVKLRRSPVSAMQEHMSDDGGRLFHSEKFIVLGNSVTENTNLKWGDDENREQPIFTVRAHVFQIDPETKKNWIPASKSAVAVSYYYDSARNTYRIISVEGSKAIINSTITPNMAFTKTSQKFGQWSDPRANTVYGLGFGSEADLAKFIDKFKEVKELIRQQAVHSQSPTTVNGTVEDSQPASATPRETPPNRGFFHTRSSSLTSMREPQVEQQTEQKENVNLRERRNSFNTPGTNGNTSPESQLKYENDKLKLALAQSSSNAKKWEIELQTLKNNNNRLTAALQESTANVDEWKKQLAAYKDETGRLRKKISEMEQRKSNPEETVELKTEIAELKDRVESLQRDHKYKDQEVDQLQQRLAEMTTQETANGNLQNKLKALEEENTSLKQQVHDLKQLLQEYRKSQDKERDELVQLQDHLGSKITELYEFHEHILATLQKESSS